MSLDFTRLRLDNASQRVNQFIDDHIVEWTEEEIADKIRQTITSLGLSQRVRDAVSVEKTDFMSAEVVFDLQDGDIDISDLLEKGSRPHVIEPKGRDSGGADVLRWFSPSGNPVFRRKVQHPGFEGYHFMEEGVRQNEFNLQRRIEREVDVFMQKERLN